MGHKVRKNISSILRKARDSKDLSLSQVAAKLATLGIEGSKSNLNRIELNQISCRSDILAGLCLIYDIDPKDILYK